MTYREDEGVAETRHGVRNLVAKLNVVVVDPTATNGCGSSGNTVKGSHALLGEESGQDLR